MNNIILLSFIIKTENELEKKLNNFIFTASLEHPSLACSKIRRFTVVNILAALAAPNPMKNTLLV